MTAETITRTCQACGDPFEYLLRKTSGGFVIEMSQVANCGKHTFNEMRAINGMPLLAPEYGDKRPKARD